MNCRLCLDSTENFFNFFDEKGLSLNASKIVGKYFWFEPQHGDFISNAICLICWEIIENFHNLYVKVEQTQSQHNNFFFNVKCDPSDLTSTLDEPSNSELNSNLNSIPSSGLTVENGDCINNLKCEKENNFDVDSKFRAEEYSFEQQKQTRSFQNRITQTQQSKKKSSHNQSKNLKLKSIIDNDLAVEPSDEIESVKKRNDDKNLSEKQLKMAREDKIIKDYFKITCPLCHEKLENYPRLQKHFSQIHNQKPFVICCEAKFITRSRLVDHLIKHTNPDGFKCSICDKILKNRRTLRDHKKNWHMGVKVKKIQCRECNKCFKTNYNLKKHLLTHLPEEDRIFKCNLCDKSFPSIYSVENHKRFVHDKRYGGVCDLCGKAYQCKIQLKQHKLKHEGLTEPKIQCNICDEWLISKYLFKRHLKKHSTEKSVHKCPHCDKTSPSDIALSSHIHYTHKLKKELSCSICEMKFKKALNLKEHLTVHTGQPLYVCPHCPKTFTHISNLHHHRKQVHPKEYEEIRAKKNDRNISVQKLAEISSSNKICTI